MSEIVRLPSNDGWDFLSVESTESPSDAQDGHIAGTIAMSGRFWDRRIAAQHGFEKAELTDDFAVRLFQPLLMLDAITELERVFRSEAVGSVVDLCGGADGLEASLLLLSQDPGIISDGKPVLKSRFHTPRLTVELCFVTDQSCLRLAAEGIAAWLRS
jgi:hypothetical protein